MIIFLNGRAVEHYPQSYVTTASTILANVFGLSLATALGAAFTLHLWHILQTSANKLDVIESLFAMRSCPFTTLHCAVLKAASGLCSVALLLGGLNIATNFPPGALTVIPWNNYTTQMVSALTVDTGFIGDGSSNAFGSRSLVIMFSGGYESFLNPSFLRTSSSPCGVNYWFIIQFKGPYLLCSNTVIIERIRMTNYFQYMRETGYMNLTAESTPEISQ